MWAGRRGSARSFHAGSTPPSLRAALAVTASSAPFPFLQPGQVQARSPVSRLLPRPDDEMRCTSVSECAVTPPTPPPPPVTRTARGASSGGCSCLLPIFLFLLFHCLPASSPRCLICLKCRKHYLILCLKAHHISPIAFFHLQTLFFFLVWEMARSIKLTISTLFRCSLGSTMDVRTLDSLRHPSRERV